MTKQELVELIKENFIDEDGDIDITELDFGNKNVYLSRMKAKRISQCEHKARIILQGWHEAYKVYQSGHKGSK